MTRTTSPVSSHRRAAARRALAIGGGASLALLLAFLASRDPAPAPLAPLQANLFAPGPAPAAPPSATAPIPASRRPLSERSPADRARALDQLEENFRADPLANTDLVVATALELAPRFPAEAFFFLARFHGSAPITQAKRAIVLDWSASGLDGVAATLRQQVREQRGGCESLMPFLVSIYQNERASGFAGFLGWADTFSAPAEREIKVSVADSFLRLCPPGQRTGIARLYAKQADMHPWAAALLVRHADDAPAETLELVGHADFADLPVPLLADVLKAVAETSPADASRAAKTEYFQEMAAYQAHATGAELSAVRDELLSGLLNGLLVSDPASAWELAGRLADESLRQQMLDRIQNLIIARK